MNKTNESKCVDKCKITKVATGNKEHYLCLSCKSVYPVIK